MNEALWIYAAWYAVSRLLVVARWMVACMIFVIMLGVVWATPPKALTPELSASFGEALARAGVWTVALPLYFVPVFGEWVEWKTGRGIREIIAKHANK